MKQFYANINMHICLQEQSYTNECKKGYFNSELANDLIHHATKKQRQRTLALEQTSGVRTTSNGWHREESLKSQLSARLILVSH